MTKLDYEKMRNAMHTVYVMLDSYCCMDDAYVLYVDDWNLADKNFTIEDEFNEFADYVGIPKYGYWTGLCLVHVYDSGIELLLVSSDGSDFTEECQIRALYTEMKCGKSGRVLYKVLHSERMDPYDNSLCMRHIGYVDKLGWYQRTTKDYLNLALICFKYFWEKVLCKDLSDTLYSSVRKKICEILV